MKKKEWYVKPGRELERGADFNITPRWYSQDGIFVNTEWMELRPRQYCCYCTTNMPPCHEADITSIDRNAVEESGRENGG